MSSSGCLIPAPISPVVLADLPPTDTGFTPPDTFAQQRARELWALWVRGQVPDQLLAGTVAVREADRVLAAGRSRAPTVRRRTLGQCPQVGMYTDEI